MPESAKLDIAPLTVIVSEQLDPRVRRKLEAEQQAEVRTYDEMSKEMEMADDLNKIKEEVESKGEDVDPFKSPESVEDKTEKEEEKENTPAQPETPEVKPEVGQDEANDETPATTDEKPEETKGTENKPQPADDGDSGDEDLTSAFESSVKRLPPDLLHRVLKDYVRMESSDLDTGELEHIKTLVFVDLGQNAVKGDTLESVQTIRDPENTIVVISETDSPNADTTLRARNIAKNLANRGVKVFYSLDEATEYLNDLYDIVSGRKKG